MRASVLRSAGVVVVEDRPVPEPAAGEVLVRVRAVGVCGSDVHYYEHGRIGHHVVERPIVLGHEASGEVVSLGPALPGPGPDGGPDDATGLLPGTRVSLEPGVPCRSCAQCLAGRYNLCPRMRFFATPPFDGAFQEYVALPAPFVHPVPDDVGDDAAALLEPLSVAVWACRRSAVTVGSEVLVNGGGPIGLACAQTARAFGAARVWVADVSAPRLALAERLGAEPLDVSRRPVGEQGIVPDVLLECSGSPRATTEAIRTVARAGRVVLVGMGADEVALPLPHVQDHELTITGAFRYANTWPTAIGLAASGRVDLDALVTGHYGLDEVEQALTAGRRDPQAVKAVVHPVAS